MKIFRLIKDLTLCIFSAIILILCFPKVDIGVLGWVALAPFFMALDGKGKFKSFLLGYFFGIVFFTGTLYWFVYVHIAAVISLVMYFSVYTGIFGIFYSMFSKKGLVKKMLILSCAWVMLDFIRDYLLTGFGWVSVGLTQYKNLSVIQIADITGVYGVTFAVVLFNLFFKELIVLVLKFSPSRLRSDYFRRQRKIDYSRDFVTENTVFGPLIMILIVFTIIFSYGNVRLKYINEYYHKNRQNSYGLVKVAVIQANIPQDMKWEKEAWSGILDKYFDLTRQAAEKKPHLIIWPETALPGVIGEDDEYLKKVKDFVVDIHIPLLFGAVVHKDGDYYNSAVLIKKDGTLGEVYAKTHLVPFGEYVPFRSLFPRLAEFVPIADFTAGKEYVNFSSPVDSNDKYSVLICFEDTIARLARKFVRRGSELFVNITNDAWFMDTKAPFLHLQDSVFRAVENRRCLVRCANTGVSSFIDPLGKITKYLQDDSRKKTFVSGFLFESVILDNSSTFYTVYGDIFASLCIAYFLFELVLVLFRKNKKK